MIDISPVVVMFACVLCLLCCDEWLCFILKCDRLRYENIDNNMLSIRAKRPSSSLLIHAWLCVHWLFTLLLSHYYQPLVLVHHIKTTFTTPTYIHKVSFIIRNFINPQLFIAIDYVG